MTSATVLSQALFVDSSLRQVKPILQTRKIKPINEKILKKEIKAVRKLPLLSRRY